MLDDYKHFYLSGQWHVHTKYTDGANDVHEYCKRAVELNIPLIAFTEHVRCKLDYNFGDFMEDIQNAKDEFPDLLILSGCETKVLPSGELDVTKEILEQIDVVIFAYHGFPRDLDLYVSTLKKAIQNPYVDIWAHPGLFLKKNNLLLQEEQLIEIAEMLKNHGILVELNKKYSLPIESWIDAFKNIGIKFVNGGDAHSIQEL